HDDDDGSFVTEVDVGRRICTARNFWHQVGNLPTHRDASDRQLRPPPEVGLYENAHRVATGVVRDAAGRSTDATFEAVANHPCPAADVAFDDRTALRVVYRGEDVRLSDVLAAHVVQRAIPRLGDDRQKRPVARRMPLVHVRNFGG